MSEKVICNHLGCREEVKQTKGNTCGGQYGEDEYSCGEHLCPAHLETAVLTYDGQIIYVCDKCADYLLDAEEWYVNPVEECLIKIQDDN